MRTHWWFALAFLLFPRFAPAQAPQAGVDPRIELMSILFRLAGNNEYAQGRVPSYIQAIDRHFGPFRDHEAVKLARTLRQTDGVSYDAVMNMAIHLKDAKSLTERVPFDSPDSRLDKRWHGAKAVQFVRAARRFVADSRFEELVKSQQALYELTNTRLRQFLEANADFAWFDRFFGARPRARFFVVPGLVNGGSSYGASLVAEDGVEEMYAIPGVWQVDNDGNPVFPAGWRDMLIHEFVHSYVNGLVDRHAAKLEAPGIQIFETVRDAMRTQAYGAWKTVLYESLVRASTVRYIAEHSGGEAAAKAVESEHARMFLWTGELSELLARYEKDRASYATLDSFMPQIVQYFEQAAPRVKEMARRYDERRPTVASMSIANNALDVDYTLKEIVIRFDRPMRKTSWAVTQPTPEKFPKMGSVRYDESGTVFTIPVTLEPSRDYEFGLNWPGGGSFASADGISLKHVLVKFRTRSAPE